MQLYHPQFQVFPKKERRYAAPKVRNTKIAENVTIIVAFWDGKSTGRKDTIDKARALEKKVYIFER